MSAHPLETYDPDLPPEGQVGRYAEIHDLDHCDCGAKADMWKSLQHDGERFYWYLEWICQKDPVYHHEDRIDPYP